MRKDDTEAVTDTQSQIVEKTGRQERRGRVFIDEGVGKKQREEVWEFPGINLQCFTTLSLLLAQCR